MTAGISRRSFLFGSLAAGAAGAVAAVERHPLARLLDWRDESPLAAGAGVLVLITLYGGNDGLNTVVPVGDSRYLAARGDLGYKPEEVLRLRDGLGLHPNLTGFKRLWDSGHLAVVRGVGYPNPDHSHFRSMDIWQSADPSGSSVTGWLGRWLDGAGAEPLRAVSVGANVPRLLVGERTSGTAVPVGSFSLPGSAPLQAGFRSLTDPARQPSPLAGLVAQSGSDLLTASAVVTKAEGPGAAGSKTPAAVAPGRGGERGSLARPLDLVATLIEAHVPSRVYAVSMSGFDTHANEKGNHARLLGQLDAAVSSFLERLAKVPHASGVTVLIYSEFGRRVAANASGGTDHGTAAPVFVAGPAVKGGFVGDEPSLAALDEGDLRATTDFRSVYASALGKILDVDARHVIPGGRFADLHFL